MNKVLHSYYQKTADDYDKHHMHENEHVISLALLLSLMKTYGYKSLLDVGAGTGRVLRATRTELKDVEVKGIEPSEALREVAYRNGVERNQLMDGNATMIDYQDDSWDIVSSFGILHHIADPNQAVEEMCRVAKHGIFFSDLNNFGCGSWAQRCFSQTLRRFHLWRPFQYLKNGGKFEKYSEGDGIHYSYSLFDSLETIKRHFPQTYIMNTKGNGKSIYHNCSHMCVFAVADESVLMGRSNINKILSHT